MLSEQAFRRMLDEHGLLRDGALEPPSRDKAFTVFAQRDDARIELDAWKRHADQFFRTRLGLTSDKSYAPGVPRTDAAQVMVAPEGGREGLRLCFARPRGDDDLRAAEDADAHAGAAGLGLLARRCRTVWLVEAEGEDDAVALRIAAILASVVLGPILSPGASEIFGVKTARETLESAVGPYR